MPEANQILYTHKELAEILVRDRDLHQGFWGVSFEFGLQGANIGPDDGSLRPAAILGILKVGLQRMEKETNLSVDASKVNPKVVAGRRAAKKS